ncbi:hypothetical protein [Marinobacterium rhizophilum]|uniref:Uncharacterized protein n=1 Tax=Marinobacterium rhizophilum TaxID=420402 RepID=A0ABY5HGC4_9GAMM|nr:hypothetical protein [Marinobacterium rhizophilum]UTW10354.1 hypothetical protein KDW95_13700 [Marinobacterium rhizophilum]
MRIRAALLYPRLRLPAFARQVMDVWLLGASDNVPSEDPILEELVQEGEVSR